MSMPEILLIVAQSDNRAIGHQGAMPWHLPRDLKHFKAQTLGHPVIMGRKTYDSIGRALPGRQNLVISRNAALALPDAQTCPDLATAIARARGDKIFIIGGAEIYRWPIPCWSRTSTPMSQRLMRSSHRLTQPSGRKRRAKRTRRMTPTAIRCVSAATSGGGEGTKKRPSGRFFYGGKPQPFSCCKTAITPGLAPTRSKYAARRGKADKSSFSPFAQRSVVYT